MIKSRVFMATAVAILLAAVLVPGGDRFYRVSTPQKSGYSAKLKDLQTKFNADKGKVRLLMLLSPT